MSTIIDKLLLEAQNTIMNLPLAEKRRIGREQLWNVLHDGKGRAGHAFNFTLIILILISTALVPLEFLPGRRSWSDVIHTIEATIVALFTVEYILRIYAAPNRLRYIFSFFGLVDLFSIIPFYAGVFGTEYIRFFRLIRLIKLTEINAAAQQDGYAAMERGIRFMDGERVEYVVTKSPVTLIFGVIPPIVAIIFGLGVLLNFSGYISLAIGITLFVFAFIFLWKAWLDFSYDVIYLTNRRLILQNQHILGRSINQVSYPSITNVKPFYPNAISYILRYGSLVIDTAAEHPGQISLHTVRNHEHAAHEIMQRCFKSTAEAGGGER